MTLGERLEEARKRKGISLREAAEATKVRSDFLAALESNAFEQIELPQIYVRGFLKIYAKFLRLDAEKMATDYDALQRSGRGGRREMGQPARPEPLGRLEVAERAPVRRPAAAESEESADAAAAAEPRPRRERSTEDAPPALDAVMKVRIALAIAATVLVLGLLWGLIKLVTRDRDPGIADQVGTPAARGQAESGPRAGAPVVDTKRAELIALDAVTVVVDQVNEQGETRRLYAGTLARGERFPVEFRGSLRLQFSEGRFLQVEQGGQILSIQQAGPGRTTLR